MPIMKHVMTLGLIAIAAMLTTPAGHADPDPHRPDFGANYCPGGGGSSPEPFCDGVPYPDGSYWHAIQRGTSGTSFVVVQCVVPAPPPGPFSGLLPQPQLTGPIPAPAGSCQ